MRIAGPAYILVAFLGRIPLAMSQMGALVLVSTSTGRYAAGGAAAGALAVANAIGAPIAGALADRRGQRTIVLAQSLVGAAGLIGLVAAARAESDIEVLVAVAALAGLAMPQVGPLARVRWRPITRTAGDNRVRLIDAAYSYEGAADEASFVLGPALVGVMAVAINPSGALVLAAVLLAVFGSWFAVHRTSALPHREPGDSTEPGPLWTATLIMLLVAQMLVGVFFGSIQTGSTVLATVQGQPGLAGLIHALLGVGSVVAGLAVAGLPATIGYDKRMLVAASGLFVLSAPLLLVDDVVQLMLVVLVLGFAVAPYMISNFASAGAFVPTSRVGAAMTLLAASTGLGYAIGSSVAGRLADAGGHTSAFAVTVTAGGIAFVVAATFRSRLAATLASA